MGSYLVAFPGFLAYPYLGHVVSYVTMTCAFATGVGHGLFILLRRDFFRRRELVRLATTDTLTGVFNRRHFLEAAEREVRRGRRYARPLSVLMIDVDSFKSINDGHGHPVGDEALRRFAALAAGILRQSDFIGRMGGDEFVIVLTETALGAAAAVAERLRAATTDAPLAVEGAAVPWSVSIGCAELAPGEEEIEAPLKRADRALLDAKRAGRNRVVASGAVEGAADRG
jgi:diguanylate cyclase (GGDEF)-like protein